MPQKRNRGRQGFGYFTTILPFIHAWQKMSYFFRYFEQSLLDMRRILIWGGGGGSRKKHRTF